MKTVIKEGNKKPKTFKRTCHECGTKFTYQQSDVEPDWRDGDYVVCPNKKCKAFIAHN